MGRIPSQAEWGAVQKLMQREEKDKMQPSLDETLRLARTNFNGIPCTISLGKAGTCPPKNILLKVRDIISAELKESWQMSLRVSLHYSFFWRDPYLRIEEIVGSSFI